MKIVDRFIGRKIRKPSGLTGRLLGRLMAREHVPLVDWMLASVDIRPDARVLDVGCGGGETLRAVARLAPDGFVTGLDYSADMVALARRRNAAAIAAGRVEVVEGDVAALPFPDAGFDVVLGVETFYFWPDPLAGLREIRRVLRPGGTLALVMDISKPSADAPVPEDVGTRMGFRVYCGEEMTRMFTEAGFRDAGYKSRPDRAKGWLCATGRAPGGPQP